MTNKRLWAELKNLSDSEVRNLLLDLGVNPPKQRTLLRDCLFSCLRCQVWETSQTC